MITLKNISRYKAAFTHLVASAAIAGLVLLVMIFVWYPPPLFETMGGRQLAMLIIGVDVCIGPLITLFIFDTRKKGLVFDLAVVLALQLGALTYGVHTMFIARPAFIVLAAEEMVVVSAADIAEEELAKAPIEAYRHISVTGPQLVAIRPPELISTYTFAGLFSLGIQNHPEHFVAYADKREQALKQSTPLTDLVLEPQDREQLEEYLKRSTRSIDKLRFLPITAEKIKLTAVIAADSGDLVDILAIKPGVNKH